MDYCESLMRLRPEKESHCKSCRSLFAQSFFLLPMFALFLKIFGVKRTYIVFGRIFSLKHRSVAHPQQSHAAAKRIAEAVKSANRSYAPLNLSCLPESITLWCLLRRSGIPAKLRLGVRTLTGSFESHAWVEHHETVLNDIENITAIYAPFDLGLLNIN